EHCPVMPAAGFYMIIPCGIYDSSIWSLFDFTSIVIDFSSVTMDKKEAAEFLRHFSKVGCIQYSDHCLKRMAYRNIQVDDLLMVLMWGDVQDVEYDPEYDSWKCRITGKSLDDDDLTFVAAIDVNANAVMCITVF
ncbi:MAG: DUF4258 domain-containing protein, partial [Deltaproteobacteria bacterium]